MIMNQTPYLISFEQHMSQALVCRYGEEMRQYVFKPDIDVSGLSCLLQIAKTDGTFTENGVEVHTDPDTGECTLVITIPQQATVVKGLNRYSICVYGPIEGEDHLLYSAEGHLWVDDNLITDDMIQSVAEVNGLVFPQDFLTVENLVDIVNYVSAEIIKDNTTSDSTTWSSQKISDEIDAAASDIIDDETTSETTTWSSTKINDEISQATGATQLGDLEDVNITTPANGEVLVYDEATEEWKNSALSQGHTYSTQEQIVGKWIDGRDVYEKTFEVNTTSPLGVNGYSLAHGITNLERVINYFGSTYWPGAGGYMIPSFSSDFSTGYISMYSYNSTYLGLSLSNFMKNTGGAYYIILTIQYVKGV